MERGKLEGAIRALTLLALVGATLYQLDFVYAFGQERFFTKDEFQWGHLAWLVQQGQIPYLDFYEHHLPLGYYVHAWLLPVEGSFPSRALQLRSFEFGYLLLTGAVLGFAAWRAQRNLYGALLALLLPLCFGFGLMSAIEFRADNWSGFAFLVCLALLEINRPLKRAGIAVAAGVILALAVFTTQKIALLGGLSIVVLLGLRALDRLGALKDPYEPPLLARPLVFAVAGIAVTALLLLAGANAGILGRGFEINFSEALAHERLYPDSVGAWDYVAPFLEETLLSSLVLVALAIAYLWLNPSGFWTIPLLLGLAGSLSVRAQYPYNFVLLSFLLCTCAARVVPQLVERLPAKPWTPLLYLLPLLVLPDQMGFLADRTSNEHQLALLEKIERFTEADDVVLDDSGSALFRPHRGYYWYHDRAHVLLFADYFEGPFLEDLRAARAKFWIRGSRSKQLPTDARAFLEANYLPFFGSLEVLGFETPPNGSGPPLNGSGSPLNVEVEVIRSGEYHVSLAPGAKAAGDSPWREGLEIDGQPVEARSVRLEAGMHTLRIAPGSPGYWFSWLPRQRMGAIRTDRTHDPGFEYGRR